MNGLLHDLEDMGFFLDFVTKAYQDVIPEILQVMWCQPTVDKGRVEFAHKEYMQALQSFRLYLHSANPDHYKRSGALLHALIGAKCVENLGLESTSEDLKAGFTRVTAGDAEHVLPFVEFFEEFHNEIFAFNTAYRCCQAYEDQPPKISFDYLRNVCRYLKLNPSLPVDSHFMIFKSLMQK